MGRPAYGHRYRQERLRLLSSGPVCAYDCGRRATEADHQPPLSLHLHAEGSGCCTLLPSCYWCRQRQAAALSMRGTPALIPVTVPEPVGFDVDSPVWDVPWLDDLRDVPDDAWWPRLMTAPHPRAAGSIGLELTTWARTELGVRFRWWQRLFAVRLLEVDAAGVLVWTTALLTLARQCGKSLFVYSLCEWRSEQAERFGEPQLVLHTADSLEHAKTVWQQAHPRALAHDFGLRRAAGEYEIAKPAGKWLVRSQTSAVGYTASLAVADECHGVKVETVEQRMGATTIEAAQSQTLLVSTASSQCTELFPLRREGAIARLAEPDNELLVEWSGARGTSVLDMVARRQASPHWHARRADEIRAQAERAAPYESQPYPHDLVSGVRTQFHNEWPMAGAGAVKGAPLVEAERWAAAVCDLDSVGPLVIGVEDQTGHGAAVAFCGTLADGRFVIGGLLCSSRSAAYATASAAAVGRDASTLVVGASLFTDPEVAAMPVARRLRAGASSDTPAALVNLRELLSTRRAVHDDVSPALDEQVAEARVRGASGGLALIGGPRSDLLRAAVWALRVAATQPAPSPAIH